MISLEACISVTTFLVIMFFISGLFVLFMAQNVTAHVTLQTTQSLSLDVYANEKITKELDGMNDADSVSDWVELFVSSLFGADNNEKEYFITDDDEWYKAENSGKLGNVVKQRFIGYLGGGSTDRAESILSMLNVKDGLEGLDFSGSYIEDGTLYVVLRYELQDSFNIGNLGNIAVTQTSCAKLWKER